MKRRKLAISIAAMTAYAAATFGLYVLIGSLFGLIPEFITIAAGIAASFPLGRRLGRWVATS